MTETERAPPIDEPLDELPARDPPGAKRPPKQEPVEPKEIPHRDPNPLRPQVSRQLRFN